MSSTIIPTLRYKDAPKMIAWLCDTFGFEKQLVVDDNKGGIMHAQLTLNGGMIMLGSVREDSQVQRQPGGLSGVTQSPYVVVSDVDGICEKAREAGAEIVMEPEDQDHGGRLFSCRAPEGHLWHLGSYDPWQSQITTLVVSASSGPNK